MNNGNGIDMKLSIIIPSFSFMLLNILFLELGRKGLEPLRHLLGYNSMSTFPSPPLLGLTYVKWS